MTSTTQIRNAAFSALQPELSVLQRRVLEGLQTHGPCTTRALAAALEISLLTVRPRVCELVGLGFAVCTGREGKEGVYRAATADEIRRQRTVDRGQKPEVQTEMELR